MQVPKSTFKHKYYIQGQVAGVAYWGVCGGNNVELVRKQIDRVPEEKERTEKNSAEAFRLRHS